MSKFKVGDVVKRVNGKNFSNGKTTATVGEWDFGFEKKNRVSLVETGTYIEEYQIKLVNTSPVRETTVIKKEIVPGTYGDVRVGAAPRRIYVDVVQDKTKLAETIKTLQLIHDAME